MSTEDKLESEWKHVALSLPTTLADLLLQHQPVGWESGNASNIQSQAPLWLTESYPLNLLFVLF